MGDRTNCNESRDLTTTLSGMDCHPSRRGHGLAIINVPTLFEVSVSTYYEGNMKRDTKCV